MTFKTILFSLLFLTSQQSLAEGLVFECDHQKLHTIDAKIHNYFKQLGIDQDFYKKQLSPTKLELRLKKTALENSTLYLRWDPQFNIQEELIQLPATNGKRDVHTVSKKEITLALMQSGRETIFKGPSCTFEAFQDHVNVRQMIVAWAEHLHWKFPDGSSAKWNEAYWENGTLKPGKPLSEAMSDFFINEDSCSVGCYTATKIVFIQGILDYYQRIKQDSKTAQKIKDTLRSDGEVLVNIEPELMWQYLEKDKKVLSKQAKLLTVKQQVAPLNFIPGDWVYFINTDTKSSDKAGYEGSNSIYMGRAKFDDFYNDNGHHYFYNEKLSEVYNWRNGVYSRSQDYEKLQSLSPDLLNRLSLPPSQGGIVLNTRAVPHYFGFN
jgi:hypothetical protein